MTVFDDLKYIKKKFSYLEGILPVTKEMFDFLLEDKPFEERLLALEKFLKVKLPKELRLKTPFRGRK